MASIFENSQTSTGAPWGPLVDPTMQGVDYMRNLLTRGAWGGPYTAGIDPRQTAGINAGAGQYGLSGQVGGAFGQAGQQLMPGIGQSFDYYNRSAQNPTAMNPLMNNTQAYMGLGGQFAQNPYVDNMVQAALRDPMRQFTEQTMPGINDQAIMRGTSGGSPQGIAQGIAQRGFADRAADVSSQIRMPLYQQGLQTGVNASQQDYMLAQNAAQQMGQMGMQGLGLLGEQYNFGQRGAQDLFNWGGQNQQLQNQQLQGQMEQFMAPWELAKSYGSYMNPLAGGLKTETTDQNMLGAYLFQGLGPILGGIGASVGDDAWDWVKGIWESFGDNP